MSSERDRLLCCYFNSECARFPFVLAEVNGWAFSAPVCLQAPTGKTLSLSTYEVSGDGLKISPTNAKKVMAELDGSKPRVYLLLSRCAWIQVTLSKENIYQNNHKKIQ